MLTTEQVVKFMEKKREVIKDQWIYRKRLLGSRGMVYKQFSQIINVLNSGRLDGLKLNNAELLELEKRSRRKPKYKGVTLSAKDKQVINFLEEKRLLIRREHKLRTIGSFNSVIDFISCTWIHGVS